MSKERPLNDRWRRFCELVVMGRPAGRAYEEAGFRARGNAAETEAAQGLRKPQVASYIETLRNKAIAASDMTRDELVKFLADAIRTPVGQIDENNPLAQEVIEDSIGESTMRKKIKSVGKLEAAKQLAAMLGWNEPEKDQLDVEIIIGGNAESHNQD